MAVDDLRIGRSQEAGALPHRPSPESYPFNHGGTPGIPTRMGGFVSSASGCPSRKAATSSLECPALAESSSNSGTVIVFGLGFSFISFAICTENARFSAAICASSRSISECRRKRCELSRKDIRRHQRQGHKQHYRRQSDQQVSHHQPVAHLPHQPPHYPPPEKRYAAHDQRAKRQEAERRDRLAPAVQAAAGPALERDRESGARRPCDATFLAAALGPIAGTPGPRTFSAAANM